MHRQTADGEWRLEPTEGVAVLSSHRALVAAALAHVKYDKIAVVREVRCCHAGPRTLTLVQRASAQRHA